jgi:hypothetical protein
MEKEGIKGLRVFYLKNKMMGAFFLNLFLQKQAF